MADHDLPKMLGYVLNHTKQEKIFYAGHSMGTTTFMIMSNLHPEIQDHIILANFLAPVAYVEHLKGPLRSGQQLNFLPAALAYTVLHLCFD